MDAQVARFEGRLAARGGGGRSALRSFKAASGILRELPLPWWLAVSLLEQGEALARNGEPAEAGAVLDEAKAIFERLGAEPWLERLASTQAESGALAG